MDEKESTSNTYVPYQRIFFNFSVVFSCVQYNQVIVIIQTK